MPTTLPTGFAPLPTAFGLPASNPPYPPAVGSASRAHSIRLPTGCAGAALGRNPPRHRATQDNAHTSPTEGCNREGGIDLVRPHTTVTPGKPLAFGLDAHSARDHWRTRAFRRVAPTLTRYVTVNRVIPCASRLAISRECTRQNSLQDNETSRHRPVSADQREGVFARALSANPTLVERKAGARGTRRSAKRDDAKRSNPRDRARNRPGRGGVAADPSRPRDIRPASYLSRLLPKNLLPSGHSLFLEARSQKFRSSP
jgi:hypothetical protein